MLGVMSEASPALCERAVLGVLNNTFDEAAEAFSREGVQISVKRIRTISLAFSAAALAERQKKIDRIADADPPVQEEHSMKGRRIVLTMDGGRIRIRRTKRGRKKAGAAGRGFDAEWREPKLFSIYEIDQEGKKKRLPMLACDGTIDGPEGFMKILAAELVRIGAKDAEKIAVAADGAPWIWNRLDGLFSLAGIEDSKVVKILDFYHAAEHLKAVSEMLFGSPARQTRWFNEMRKTIKDRSPKVFMEKLRRDIGRKNSGELETELEYFESNAGSMNYRQFKRMKMPIGSGVIESTIRRVVNLRLKGAGMFWLLENAEGFLHLRCQLKSGNWDSFFSNMLVKISNQE